MRKGRRGRGLGAGEGRVGEGTDGKQGGGIEGRDVGVWNVAMYANVHMTKRNAIDMDKWGTKASYCTVNSLQTNHSVLAGRMRVVCRVIRL